MAKKMKELSNHSIKQVAFLRGINVGGHHKVPMNDLKKELAKLDFKNIVTLLNTGNIIFESNIQNIAVLENSIATHLEKVFNFPIPILIRKAAQITALVKQDPFKNITPSKDIRLYVSFLRKENESSIKLPWNSTDGSFKIIERIEQNICSVLDLSVSKTAKSMEVFEKFYGKDITTRNWNTIIRIAKKLDEV